jgi:site-specific DNA recombinase
VFYGSAEAIRWAAHKVLSGWSLPTVAAAPRERGLTGAHGGRLTVGSVRQMVTNPTVAGHRIHQGRDLGKASWEPFLTEDVWQRAGRSCLRPGRSGGQAAAPTPSPRRTAGTAAGGTR